MTTRTRIYSAGALACAAAIAVFFWAFLARLRAEAALAGVMAQRASVISRARRLDALRAAADRKTAALQLVIAAQRAAASNPSPLARANDPLRVLMNDAKLQAQYFAARRANLRSLYGPLFHALGISVEQTGRFEELLMQRDEKFFDVVATVPEAIQSSANNAGPFSRQPFLLGTSSEDGQPLRPVTPEARAAVDLLRENDEAFAQTATALLGPDGFEKFQQFERVMPVRDMVASVGSELAGGAAPLTPAQADQLTQILAAASNTYQSGGTARPNLIYDWDQVRAQAAAVLAPEQMTAFQAQIAPALASRQLRTAIREAGGFGEMGKILFKITGRDS